MPDLALTKLSETASTITLGWTPPAGAQGYLFFAGARRSSTLDGSRSSVRFSKGTGPYRVQALGVIAEGSYPPPVVPSSGPSYPASYFTGPLGQRNMLPGKQGAFLIDYYGGVGTSWDQYKVGVAAREQQIGRKFDGLHVHYAGDETYMGVPNCIAPGLIPLRMEEWIVSRGSFPCVVWNPGRSNANVNSGDFDQGLRNVADHFKSYPFRIMLRLWTEFDAPHVVYTPAGAAGGPAFIEAWQRVVRIFREQGATNVGFWWCPSEGWDRAKVKASYPGDAYVDWVGSDSYNWCAHSGDPDCYSTPYRAGPASFAECFDYAPGGPDNPLLVSQHDQWGPRKPFVIGETNTILDPTAPSSWKGDWYRQIPAAAKKMEWLRGVSIYDCDVTAAEGPKTNFRVDAPTSNPDPLAGFKAWAADPWFNTGPPR